MRPNRNEKLDRPTDAALVNLAAANDREAFGLIYRRYVDRVRGTIYRIAGGEHLDDLTQDCFVRIWKNIAKLSNPDFLGTWVYRVAVNTALDAIRGHRPVFALPHLEAVDRHAHQYELRATVAQLLQELPRDARTIIVLCDIQGCTRNEAAEILRIPEGTVKSRLSNARKLAREFLQRTEDHNA